MSEPPAYHNPAWFWATLREHENLSQMCQSLNLNYTAVYQYAARNYGYSGGKARLSDNERQQILQLFASGVPVPRISREVERPDTTVRRVLFGSYGVRVSRQEALERLAGYMLVHHQKQSDDLVVQAIRGRQDRAALALPSADVYRRLFGTVRAAVREARSWMADHLSELKSPDALKKVYDHPGGLHDAERELGVLRKAFPAVSDLRHYPKALRGRLEATVRAGFLKGFMLAFRPQFDSTDTTPFTEAHFRAIQLELKELQQVMDGVGHPYRKLKQDCEQLRSQVEHLQKKLAEPKTAPPVGQVTPTMQAVRDIGQDRDRLLHENQQLHEALGQNSQGLRRRKLSHFCMRLRERFGYTFTFEEARQLDRQLQLERVWTYLANGSPIKVAQVGKHLVYGVLTLDEHGCWTLTTALTREMVERSGGITVHDVSDPNSPQVPA